MSTIQLGGAPADAPPKPTFPWLIVPPAATLILLFLVRTYAWMFILRSEGLLSTMLSALGLTREPLTLLFTDTAVLIGLVYGYLPFMVLPLYAALERLDPSLLEAAWDLYARPHQVFVRVVLPLSKPGVIAGCVLVFIPSLGAYVTPDLLGGARSMMIGNLIQHQYLVVRDWPFGSALSFLLMAGVLAAVALERQPFRWQGAFEGFLLMPIVIPEIMMGVAMLLFFVMIKLPLSLLTMIIAHTIFNFPVVALIVRARLRKLDPRLEEAALDLGATPWVAFKRVTLPLLMPGIIGALLMAFTLSLDDFIISFFTAGVGSTTLPIRVYGMLRSAVTPEVNALSAILVLVSMGLVAAATWVQRRDVG